MERLDKKCLKFQAYESRSEGGSIYRKDWQSSQNPYDKEKVQLGIKKTTVGTGKGALVSMDK